jgi:hypothetical protein
VNPVEARQHSGFFNEECEVSLLDAAAKVENSFVVSVE